MATLPRGPVRPVTAGIFAVGFGVRLAALLQSGGLHPNPGSDPSVYYAAADALVHGRLPYVDFVLLHPPLLMLLLAPLAALGAVTADPVGWFLANLAGCVAGAVNAVLVTRIARRFGAAPLAATAGGLWYAAYFGALLGEHDARLEAFGNLFLLLGILAAARAVRSPRALPLVAAGARLAASVCVKIWYVVPAVVVLGWVLWRVRSRRGALALAGAAAAGAVVAGPFFLAGPAQFVRMIFLEQLSRPARVTRPTERLGDLFAAKGLLPHLDATAAYALAALTLATLAVLAASALRWAAGRLAVALLVAQLLTFLGAPSWFSFYDAYPAVGIALCIALSVPAGRAADARTRLAARVTWVPVTLAASLTAALFASGLFVIAAFPGGRVGALLPETGGCVMVDEPATSILMDRLSADLARGCPNWVDVGGHRYRYLLNATGRAQVAAATRRADAALVQYLRSGQAAVVVRVWGTSVVSALARHGTIDCGRGYAVYPGVQYRGTLAVTPPR